MIRSSTLHKLFAVDVLTLGEQGSGSYGATELPHCRRLAPRDEPDSAQASARGPKKRPYAHGRIFLGGGRFEPEIFSRP
jgi:hypothetical protein